MAERKKSKAQEAREGLVRKKAELLEPGETLKPKSKSKIKFGRRFIKGGRINKRTGLPRGRKRSQ